MTMAFRPMEGASLTRSASGLKNESQQPCTVALIGAPVEEGAGVPGCGMGPSALRIAGLSRALSALGHDVTDKGNLTPDAMPGFTLPGRARNAETIAGWTRAVARTTLAAFEEGAFPLLLGGDHSLAMGSVSAAARHAATQERPLFVLWLDAHADFNTPSTSPSGNMHGMPVAFFCGWPGFEGILPDTRAMVTPQRVTLFGVRSIDADERRLVRKAGIAVHDMRDLDEFGIVPLTRSFLERVAAENGMLHVSLDVDFLDPAIAPGVGTTVRGGATYREAHLLMELLCDSDLVTSMDLVELNPFLDERGASALLLSELVASLFGQQIFDKTAR